MAKNNFDKFIKKEVKGAKKKEQIKQEKKQVKKEREAFFIEKKRELRAIKKLQDEQYQRDAYDRKKNRQNPEPKPAGRIKVIKANEEQPAPVTPKKHPQISEKSDSMKAETRPAKKPERRSEKPVAIEKKPVPAERKAPRPTYERIVRGPKQRPAPETGFDKKIPASKPVLKPEKVIEEAALMPLNKYIAHAGVCSRRDAGQLVKDGNVTVNDQVVTEPGTKVSNDDEVKLNGKKLFLQHNLVYILLNKPKDYITTSDDPQGRKTVLDIVKGATSERIYPVGRLDRNTSGVLLLTNDGELAQQLTHPSFEVRKIYEAKLDKPLTKADFTKLLNGVTLEDGFIKADSVAYADSKDKAIIGIEIHSGRNRVVRRMFEHLGYDVRGLDRVMFANLTKKNVERGRWRFLSEKEVRLLKYFNSAKR